MPAQLVHDVLCCTPMARIGTKRPADVDDVNAVVAGLLRDMSLAQTDQQKMFGYKRAAVAIFTLDEDLRELYGSPTPPRIAGIGPASARVIREVLDEGRSNTVEEAVSASQNRADIERRRQLRDRFLSRAAVKRILHDRASDGLSAGDHHADFQMHSEWSDGGATLPQLAAGCQSRGYAWAAVSDHSHGLKIAGGMSMDEAAQQRAALDALNKANGASFHFYQGIEANIGADGLLDLSEEEAATFDIVLAAPHSRLRVAGDQTPRLVTAIRQPFVHILAHPRGRISGVRAGVVADWSIVFEAAADEEVAIEIDGDPARQDLDYTLAAQALTAGCIFALDSDAHTVDQLAYVDTAIAHARLAGIPADRIVNCWSRDRLDDWLARRRDRAEKANDRR